jgi:hypothetical protein
MMVKLFRVSSLEKGEVARVQSKKHGKCLLTATQSEHSQSWIAHEIH